MKHDSECRTDQNIIILIYPGPNADRMGFDPSNWKMISKIFDPNLIYQMSKTYIWSIDCDPSKFDPIWSEFEPSKSNFDMKWGSNIKYQIAYSVNPLFRRRRAEISANRHEISKHNGKLLSVRTFDPEMSEMINLLRKFDHLWHDSDQMFSHDRRKPREHIQQH